MLTKWGLGTALACLSASALAAPLTINNVTLIDGTGAAPRSHMSVRIDNGRIVDIRATGAAQPGDTEIDGSGRYLLPGFFDNNAHLTVYGQPARRDTDGMLAMNT